MGKGTVAGVGLWGLGRHAFKNVLPAIAASVDVNLAGVCSRTAAKRDEATARWGGKSWADPAEMLASDDVQIVYVATPTGLHAAHGLQVLTAGKHLICEKSLASDFAGAERLLDCAAEGALVLCEALMFRHHPRFLAICAAVTADTFGRAVHAFSSFTIPPLENPGFRDDASLGGGALLDLGCYPLAAVTGLLGELSEIVRAGIAPPENGGVDRSGSASLLFRNGARADLCWGYDQAYSAELMVLGERQTLYARRVFAKDTGSDNTILLRDRFGAPAEIRIPDANGFVEMFATVVRAMDSAAERERLLAEAHAQARLVAGVAGHGIPGVRE